MNFGLLPKYIARLGNWAGRWARLLGVQTLGRRWARAERAGGRAWERGRGRRGALGRAERWRASGRASGRAGVGGSDARGTRGRAGAQAGAHGAAGWAAWARPGRAAGPGWVFGAPDSVFGLVCLGIFLSH